MKTKIKKMADQIVVIIDGKVDYETQEPFRKNLAKLIQEQKGDAVPKKIIFDFQGLEFVGSSHITSLLFTLKDFNQKTKAPTQYLNVKNEFQRMVRAFELEAAFDFTDEDGTGLDQ